MMSCGRSTGIDGKTTGDFGAVSVMAWSMFVICDLLGTRALALFRLLICQALVEFGCLSVIGRYQFLECGKLGVLSAACRTTEVRSGVVELDAGGSG